MSFELINQTVTKCITPCIDYKQCAPYIQETISIKYEFVYLFIIGLLCNELISVILSLKMNLELKYKITLGLKISYYVLNLSGIIWFLMLL